MNTITQPRFTLSVLLALLGLTAGAADLYVADFGGDIQAAVDAAASNDTVWVEDGIYVLSSEILVTNAITVRGINGPAAAIVDGDGATRCFNLDDVACTIADLTVQNGYIDGNTEYEGAGVYCNYETTVVSNCVIRGNLAEPGNYTSGGGLYGGTAIDCLIENNAASEGGGAVYTILVNCHVEGNTAGEVGGESGGNGGGLSYGSATNCVIINNTAVGVSGGEMAVGGGGLYESDAYTCVISGNKTTGDGGGACYGSLYNCTITANTAANGGGSYGPNDMYNCIVWHNLITGSGEGGGPAFASEGSAPMAAAGGDYVPGTDIDGAWSVYFSCSPGLDTSGTGNITNDPVLVSYSHIATNSPCIGAGTTNYGGGFASSSPVPMASGPSAGNLTATDIDGEAWLVPPSMGCDENRGPGTLTGPLELSISGPTILATDYVADYFFLVDGIPTLVVASLENVGSVTNPVGAVEASWSSPGTNDLILTAYNETWPGGFSMTQEVIVVSAAATAIHVSAVAGSDANDGSGWALAKQTLQAGIDAQDIAGGWVLVADGTYTNEMFPVQIDRPVTVKGTNSTAMATVIDADEVDRGVVISDDGAVLKGFTVQNGYTWDTGAGIQCLSPGATVRDCIVRDNSSEYTGGGMSGGTAVNCAFYNNVSYNDGAALYQTTAIGCALAYNETTDGGGAASYGELHNCTVVANSADYGAGGTYECDLFNTIVWHNTCNDPDYGDDIAYGNWWINVCSPDVEHGVDGSITNDPLLASSSHLSAGSPCIGAGSAMEALETDIDGEAWFIPPSIGCDEPYSPVEGDIALSIEGVTNCAEGTMADYSLVAIGPATLVVADFGDGTVVTNPIAQVSKTWSAPGLYDLVLTAWNDSLPGGTSLTQQVTVVSEAASTIHVALGGNDANDGSSWALAKQTIQAGVDAQTVYGGRVLVSNGTYTAGSQINIGFPLKLVGYGGRDETVIDGNASSTCLYLGDPNAVVSGFCLTNGSGAYGGGIRCDTTDPVITNCLITQCEALNYGGGGYYGTYIDCIIDGNTGKYGGGLSHAVAVDCLISGNEATGSTYSNAGGANNCSLYRCIVENNQCNYGGGGAYYGESHSCLFKGNSAKYGGGIYYGSHYNATVTTNTCTSRGGGSYYASLYNCIVSGNLFYSSPNNIYGGYSKYNTCSPDVTPGSNGNITNAPAFVNAAAGDYRLSAGSPCIDAGSNAFVAVAVDLDGSQRIVGGTVDMGAYEYAATGPLDSDGDGMSDADELIAGTDIHDPNDFFRVGGISNGVSGTAISWNWASNRLYSVYWTGDLVDQPFTLLTNGLTTGSFEDVGSAAYTNGFYLIQVELAP